MNVDIHEAEARLSNLVDKVLNGEDVVLARNGKLLVKFVPVESALEKRPVGLHARGLSSQKVEESLKPLCL